MTDKEYFYLYFGNVRTEADFTPHLSGEPVIFLRLNACQAKTLAETPMRGIFSSPGFPVRIFFCNRSKMEQSGLRMGIRFSLIPEKLFRDEEWTVFFNEVSMPVDGRDWSRVCKTRFSVTADDIAVLFLFQNRIVSRGEISRVKLTGLFDLRKMV